MDNIITPPAVKGVPSSTGEYCHSLQVGNLVLWSTLNVFEIEMKWDKVSKLRVMENTFRQQPIHAR